MRFDVGGRFADRSCGMEKVRQGCSSRRGDNVRQGSVRTRFRTIPVVVLFAAAMAAPAVAQADPLLSGYGGPGQGNQAILGSALLNGPSGGSSGGGGPAASGPANISAPSASESGTGNQATGLATTGRGGVGKRLARGVRRVAGRRGVVGQPSRTLNAYTVPRAGTVAQPSATLGLSGVDFLYIVLALSALAFTAMLTVWATRANAVSGQGH
jgi:hypothetical protein